MFTYIYSLLIEKDLYESQNVTYKILCALVVYLCLSSRDLFIFSVRISSCCVIRAFPAHVGSRIVIFAIAQTTYCTHALCFLIYYGIDVYLRQTRPILK